MLFILVARVLFDYVNIQRIRNPHISGKENSWMPLKSMEYPQFYEDFRAKQLRFRNLDSWGCSDFLRNPMNSDF